MKRILITFILISIFAVGTLTFVDTVEAAKWKKYDSGKFADEYNYAGYKKIAAYQSYTKGDNNLYVDTYIYPKNGNSKKLAHREILIKKNNNLKITNIDYISKEKTVNYYTTTYSVKRLYKNTMNYVIKENAIPPEKKAIQKQSFTVNNDVYKVYGIRYSNESITGYIYKNNEEYSRFGVDYVYYMEYNNKVIFNKNFYREYNQKMKVVSRETFSPTRSLTSIYKTKLNNIINKIKAS